MEHPSIIGHSPISSSSERRLFRIHYNDTLPLINQPALGGIKDRDFSLFSLSLSLSFTTNSWFYFPKIGVGCPLLIWRLSSLSGLAWEASSSGSLLCLIPSSCAPLITVVRLAARPSRGQNYRGRHPAITVMPQPSVLRQLPGPLIISDEMTPGRLRNDNVEEMADSPLKSYY